MPGKARSIGRFSLAASSAKAVCGTKYAYIKSMRFDDSEKIGSSDALRPKRGIVKVQPAAASHRRMPMEQDGFAQYMNRPRTPPKRSARDVARTHGVADEDLSANMSNAIASLVDEIAELYRDLDVARHRIEHLEDRIDQDPLSGCLTAEGARTVLARLLALDASNHTHSNLVMLVLPEWQHLRHGIGREAADAVAAHVGATLNGYLGTGEYAGRTGDDEFTLLMVACDNERSRERAEEIAADLRGNPVSWQANQLTLDPLVVSIPLEGHESVEAVYHEADRVLRKVMPR